MPTDDSVGARCACTDVADTSPISWIIAGVDSTATPVCAVHMSAVMANVASCSVPIAQWCPSRHGDRRRLVLATWCAAAPWACRPHGRHAAVAQVTTIASMVDIAKNCVRPRDRRSAHGLTLCSGDDARAAGAARS
jgi:hypothetical protein